MSDTQPVGIILAAGKGTRMKSDLPKALHNVVGLPMVEHIARSMRKSGIERVVIVIGHRGELVEEALGDCYEYVWQKEQLGTGHATRMAAHLLQGHKGPVIVSPGDAPLIDEHVFQKLLASHDGFQCTVCSSIVEEPHGYGRVVRDSGGKPSKIVEQKDATTAQKAIKEVNAALYCFEGATLLKLLPRLRNTNAQGEYYLTDMVELIATSGGKVQGLVFDDPRLLIGVNDRWQLAQAERHLRLEILRRHAMNGVTLLDPESTFVGPDVEVGVDTVIEAGSSLRGVTKVGSKCHIGPNTRIENSTIGDETRVFYSNVNGVTMGRKVVCGPFSNLRPETVLHDGSRVGNFVEVKKSEIGAGSSAAHLTYIGDATVGSGTNIGAGVITCNYDGFVKSRTEIGNDVFVGSNSTLVAPIQIGDRALIAAGSTLTSNVPEDAGAFGRARQETKEGWAEKWREKRRSQL